MPVRNLRHLTSQAQPSAVPCLRVSIVWHCSKPPLLRSCTLSGVALLSTMGTELAPVTRNMMQGLGGLYVTRAASCPGHCMRSLVHAARALASSQVRLQRSQSVSQQSVGGRVPEAPAAALLPGLEQQLQRGM